MLPLLRCCPLLLAVVATHGAQAPNPALSPLASSAAVRPGAAVPVAEAPIPPAPAPAPMPVAGKPDPALERRLAELDAKISSLEQRTAPPAPALPAASSGAYARGTSLRVEGDGAREPVLERLRRIERELAAAQATIAAKDRTAAELVRQRDEAMKTGRQAGEKADYLSHVRDSLVAAQQALSERQERIDALNAQLGASDLQRLRSERRWYQFAGEILRLSSEDPRELPELQMRVRDATRELREVGGVPPAAASEPAKEAPPATSHGKGH